MGRYLHGYVQKTSISTDIYRYIYQSEGGVYRHFYRYRSDLDVGASSWSDANLNLVLKVLFLITQDVMYQILSFIDLRSGA